MLETIESGSLDILSKLVSRRSGLGEPDTLDPASAPGPAEEDTGAFFPDPGRGAEWPGGEEADADAPESGGPIPSALEVDEDCEEVLIRRLEALDLYVCETLALRRREAVFKLG